MGRVVVRAQRKPYPLPALRRCRRKPATCLRCATMCPMSLLAAGEGSLWLCAGVGLAGGGNGVGWRGVGLECARAPAPCFPFPATPTPHRRGEGCGTRHALLLCYLFTRKNFTMVMNCADDVYLRASLGVFFPFKAARTSLCSIRDIRSIAGGN